MPRRPVNRHHVLAGALGWRSLARPLAGHAPHRVVTALTASCKGRFFLAMMTETTTLMAIARRPPVHVYRNGSAGELPPTHPVAAWLA
jgi:hypothetical protein